MKSKAIARIVPIGVEDDARKPFYAASIRYGSDFVAGSKDDGREYHCMLKYWKVEMLPAEWNGEGLPPVGTECEWQDKNTKHWIKVLIVYASEWVTVIREDKIHDAVEMAIENYGDDKRKYFRTIRSARDKAIEALSLVILESHADDDEDMNTETYIYDAIAAGKIPGVRLDD